MTESMFDYLKREVPRDLLAKGLVEKAKQASEFFEEIELAGHAPNPLLRDLPWSPCSPGPHRYVLGHKMPACSVKDG